MTIFIINSITEETKHNVFSYLFVARPGRIQRKEHCQAFDRQYVQCTFSIPTVGRAYRNGFKKNYSFAPLNRLDTAVYKELQEYTIITEENEMIVRFQAEDPKLLFQSTSMNLTMSIGRFGSDTLKFDIAPSKWQRGKSIDGRANEWLSF